MKRNRMVPILSLCILVAYLLVLGVGPYSSASAVRDLKRELESIYGGEYTGKLVEKGTEDMVFAVEPKTCFLTDWNLRNAFGLDYRYECHVIFSLHTDNGSEIVRRVTYQAFDPMGKENIEHRAYLDLNSRKETVK